MAAGVYALKPSVGDTTDFVISGPATLDGSWVMGLSAATYFRFQVRFLPTSGSGAVRAIVQSSLDQGNTAYDVAVLDFDGSGREVAFSIAAGTTGILETTVDGASGDSPSVSEGVITSIVGDRLKLKVFNAGSYIGTTLTARVVAD